MRNTQYRVPFTQNSRKGKSEVTESKAVAFRHQERRKRIDYKRIQENFGDDKNVLCLGS